MHNYLPFEEPIADIDRQLDELRKFAAEKNADISDKIKSLEQRRDALLKQLSNDLTPWQRVQLARHPDRPVCSVYVSILFKEFVELHGDRRFSDDKAVITGIGSLDERKVMFIGHRKGRTTKDRIACNFGMPHPEGFRKALIKMKLAEKFRLPIVTFMDTTGAYPGIGAEERGIAESIAENLFVMSHLETPIVCVVIGEGASGGALGIGVGDRVLMLENSYYSVITPEGCAAILWRNAESAPKAAEAFKLLPQDLQKFGVIDEIVPEPLGGAHRNPELMATTLKACLLRHLNELDNMPLSRLVEARYQKFRRLGQFAEADDEAPASRKSARPAATRPDTAKGTSA